ncbi:hypothetical protein TOPH_03306 [Tolypocladium ophioglossoides CBS 100239]|uniref:Uncharacterized protein n=1 Tax=Tolypocladium ophioglossoides (strain CBS 100239) TaxID=1163406 RepID=A0A0L0NCP7_TOLOC|nr:hypothetical protein TOPH_03306 [Tolypocladium ophioglossoides CBS 100239]
MASQFKPDPELCHQYAQFASHMVRWQFKVIYWTMFITNLLVLFFASWLYTKYVLLAGQLAIVTTSWLTCVVCRGQLALERYSPQAHKRARTLRTYIFLCLACVAVSTVIVVMEAYALLALQFCDGENLMSLYWSTWTMIQVGSLIAMVGIILALLNSLRNRKHPPWALALGTPVLVIAGILHLFHDCTKRRVKKMRGRSSRVADEGPPMSQANTIQSPDEEDLETDGGVQVEFIGFTIEGGPIVRFTNPLPNSIPSHAEILGYCDDSRPIAAYRKGVITFVSKSDAAATEDGRMTATKERASF